MSSEQYSAIKNETAAWINYLSKIAVIATYTDNANISNKEYFKSILEGSDILMSLSASLNLKKIFPTPLHTKAIISNLFEESSELLIRRACDSTSQIRIAALKALIFDVGHLSFSNVSHILESVGSISVNETVYSGNIQSISRIQPPNKFFLTEALGATIAVLPTISDRVDIIKRELTLQDETRKLAALSSLQIVPIEELTNYILPLTRSDNFKIALEAAKALYLCGKSKVYLIILSILNDIKNPNNKALLLPLAAATEREEVWNIIKDSANSDNLKLITAALYSANSFPISIEEKADFYKSNMKHNDSNIACLAAAFAWQAGSIKAIKIIEKNLESNSKKSRIAAINALSYINIEKSIPYLIKIFEEEHNGDVIREVILCLRNILANNNEISLHSIDYLIPWLTRQIKSTDPFKRTQIAVLCGLLGKYSEDILLSSLSKEQHSYVLSAIIKALSKCNFDKTLVFTSYLNNSDPRVKSAAIEAMPINGNSACYFTQGLKDENPRVKATAIYKLFMLGQTDVISKANEMLNVPEPSFALAGCYALSQIMRVQPSILKENNPLSLAISSKARFNISSGAYEPLFLNSSSAPSLFAEMALTNGNRHRLIWLLEDYYRKNPESYAIRRMLASMLAIEGEYKKALELIDICLSENPASLADLLDAYRISVRLCEMKKATNYGNKLRKLYITLILACKHVCNTLSSKQSNIINKKLDELKEPSMNLYSIMIQLKIIEEDNQSALDLLTEIMLSRPFNSMITRKLASMLPETCGELKASLETYAASLPVTAIGV